MCPELWTSWKTAQVTQVVPQLQEKLPRGHSTADWQAYANLQLLKATMPCIHPSPVHEAVFFWQVSYRLRSRSPAGATRQSFTAVYSKASLDHWWCVDVWLQSMLLLLLLLPGGSRLPFKCNLPFILFFFFWKILTCLWLHWKALTASKALIADQTAFKRTWLDLLIYAFPF